MAVQAAAQGGADVNTRPEAAGEQPEERWLRVVAKGVGGDCARAGGGGRGGELCD